MRATALALILFAPCVVSLKITRRLSEDWVRWEDLRKSNKLALLRRSAKDSFKLEPQTNNVAKLRADQFFMGDWYLQGDTAKGVLDGCDNFKGPKPEDNLGQGFICGIEFPEQELVRKWVPANATVMEFGARFGSTSCELAKATHNSGKLVSVEPDPIVQSYLESNIKNNECHVHLLNGLIGSKPLQVAPGGGYGGRSLPVDTLKPGWRVIPDFSFDEVEQTLGLKFDTLLIDCEGCAQHMMDQIGPKLKNQIQLVIIEADMATTAPDCKEGCMDYDVFFKFLRTSGFQQVDKFNDCDHARNKAPEGTWCGQWIWHYAFKKVR